MKLNFYLTKDYENVPLRRRGENKPNQTQFQKGYLTALRSTEKVRVVKVGDTGLEPVTSCV